jgi:uncharacterized surface protein with fasciclin (FAS1) repeats
MGNNKSLVAVLGVVAAGLIVFGLVSMGNDDNKTETKTTEAAKTSTTETKEKKEETKPTPNIVEAAVATPALSTLVAAVKAADLVTTLSGAGPFTVFAPTNDAFAALPAGTLDSLLKPENKSTLAGILTYHVVSGKVLSSQLSDGQVIKTVQGAELTVHIESGKVYLKDVKGNRSQVTQPDVMTSNGVVHVISAVVLPN